MPHVTCQGTDQYDMRLDTNACRTAELSSDSKNSDLARYGLSKLTISPAAKSREKIFAAVTPWTGRTESILEEQLINMLRVLCWSAINGSLLKSQTKKFVFLLDYSEFKPGDGWLYHFKACHGMASKSVVGEATSTTEADVNFGFVATLAQSSSTVSMLFTMWAGQVLSSATYHHAQGEGQQVCRWKTQQASSHCIALL